MEEITRQIPEVGIGGGEWSFRFYFGGKKFVSVREYKGQSIEELQEIAKKSMDETISDIKSYEKKL